MGSAEPSVVGRQVDRASIGAELVALEDLMHQMETHHESDIMAVDPAHLLDAVNLVHYLALRRGDVSHLQRWLENAASRRSADANPTFWLPSRASAPRSTVRHPALARPSRALKRVVPPSTTIRTLSLAPVPPGRVPRIMVTLPSEAADDYGLVRRLVLLGMDIARINGAHDDPGAWQRMARNVRRASGDVGRSCRISMDLPGPKLRTGPLSEGPQIAKLRPERDLRGVPITPAVASLSTPGAPGTCGTVLPVDRSWIERRKPGDTIRLVDARGSCRELRVIGTRPESCEVEIWDTTYFETGTALSCDSDVTLVGALARIPQFHLLCVGDVLMLTRALNPATPWRHGQSGIPGIGCTFPSVFEAARAGQRVILDDGKLTGIIEDVTPDELRVRILSAAPKGSRYGAEKGINLPDTDLNAAAVSDADLPLLEVAAAHADMVAVSFLRHEKDVDEIHAYLKRVRAEHLGIILKIETTAAFARLPEILLHAMRSPLVGVMIARGDLAVEAGYERLAEVQEEILWLCEAAHLPVIWATEVLDQLARTGRPSRAEVTDAAMAQRAECVMLNKGPHIDTAMRVLDDILRRMSRHQRKKTPLLQPLLSWSDAVEP